MYKTYSFICGMIVSVMILSNALMTKAVGDFAGILMIHLIGLGAAFFIFFIDKSHKFDIKGIPIIYLFGGATGFFTVFFSNKVFLNLGATTLLMLSMFGQITASTLVDHFGILGMKKYAFRKSKLIGIFLMIAGIILMVLG